MALTPLQDALDQMLAQVRPIAEQSCELGAAVGRVLRADVRALCDVPPWDNSAMDGYAVVTADLASTDRLPVVQRIVAGAAPGVLTSGTAARIFTGAPVPEGADAIVMQENAERVGDAIQLLQSVTAGDHIRRRAQDVAEGQLMLEQGRRLSAADIGLAASVGISRLSVSRRPRVALISTGDELADPGSELRPGQIYNSNRPMLQALFAQWGCEVIDGGIVGDTLEQTCDRLSELASECDWLVSTGGVSVGEEDHVKAAVESLGELLLWKLAIKPGKPVAFGRIGAAYFMGLPGNPSSSFVTALTVLRPLLMQYQGASEVTPRCYWGCSDFDWPKAGSRQEFIRVRLSLDGSPDGLPVLKAYPNQSSGVLSSASWADALAVIDIGRRFDAGARVPYLLLSELLH